MLEIARTYSHVTKNTSRPTWTIPVQDYSSFYLFLPNALLAYILCSHFLLVREKAIAVRYSSLLLEVLLPRCMLKFQIESHLLLLAVLLLPHQQQ